MPNVCPDPILACTDFEVVAALNDIKCNAQEWGLAVSYNPRTAATVVKDRMGTVKRYNNDAESPAVTALSLYAFPVIFNPSTRDVEKAGLRERYEVIIYTPRLYWAEASITFDNIQVEPSTFTIQGNTYEIKEKNQANHLRTDFLQYVFGLHKK